MTIITSLVWLSEMRAAHICKRCVTMCAEFIRHREAKRGCGRNVCLKHSAQGDLWYSELSCIALVIVFGVLHGYDARRGESVITVLIVGWQH